MRRAIIITGFLVLCTPGAQAAGLPSGLMNSSHACGICHRDIHRMWRASAHAQSMEGAVFLDALLQAVKDGGDAMMPICLKCHAPLAAVVGDERLEKKVSWEGVGCDACHNLAAVDTSGINPRMIYDLGTTKRGPIRDAESDAHGIAYSDLHTSSLVCAGCHEYANSEETPILTTFSEWKRFAAKQPEKTCQSCHMAGTEADVVDPRVKRLSAVSVNLHEVPGGHSLDQLLKAVSVHTESERNGDELSLDVRLLNKGAGHAVPTGMPGRRLILVVTVRTSQGQTLEEKRVYSKSFADAAGRPIEHDGGCFAPGVRLLSDTRLMSGEQRVENFRFNAPAAASVSQKVALYYEHSPTGTPENRSWLTIFSEERSLPAVSAPGLSTPR
jgi:hypothetical protein